MDSVPQAIDSEIEMRYYFLTDWNADGLPDFLMQRYSNSDTYLRFNLGGLNFGPLTLLPGASGTDNYLQKDINNDGFVDLYSINSNQASIQVLENNDGLPSVTEIQRNWQEGVSEGFGDIDGDGKLEQVVANATNGFYTEILILRDIGNYDFVIDETINLVGYSYYFFNLVDLDLDGRSEIIYLSTDVSWRIIRKTMSGQYLDTPIGVSGFGGSPSDFVSICDFDGNGFQDLRIGFDLFLNDQFNFTKMPLQGAPGYNARFGDTNADGIVEAWWTTLPASLHSADYLGNAQFSPAKTLVKTWTADESTTAMDVGKRR
ncbi:MAG: VCBS repeat-containing protein [Lewinellaceae bacterium]|nr:VCBS repeat-containing protein [Lewinellaceae bacterium]